MSSSSLRFNELRSLLAKYFNFIKQLPLLIPAVFIQRTSVFVFRIVFPENLPRVLSFQETYQTLKFLDASLLGKVQPHLLKSFVQNTQQLKLSRPIEWVFSLRCEKDKREASIPLYIPPFRLRQLERGNFLFYPAIISPFQRVNLFAILLKTLQKFLEGCSIIPRDEREVAKREERHSMD